MARPELVKDVTELYSSTRRFDSLIRDGFDKLSNHEKDVVRNSFARARAFIVFPDGKGGYYVSFSKMAGHPSLLTIAQYDHWRKSISGSDTERVIKAFGVGRDYNLGVKAGKGNRHPAAEKAVIDFCAIAGKRPNALAEIRVMPLPEAERSTEFERTQTFEVLLAALRAADLNAVQRERLFAESAA